jgi:hypothetical protein
VNKITVISFHTPDAYYKKMSEKLENSCKNFNISYVIKEKESKGSWVQNCAQKSEYILEQMNTVPENEYVVWLDSDSQIVKNPTMFFEMEESFAIRAEPGGKTKKPSGREMISLPSKWPSNLASMWFNSGTIVFKNTPQNKKMVECWIGMNQGNNKWDQWTLQEAWCEYLPETLWLPRSYCQIQKLHGNQNAVILHSLASVEQKVKRV